MGGARGERYGIEEATCMLGPKSTVTILVVEDEEPLRQMWAKLLVRLGYRLILTGTAEEALTVLRHERVSCLLLDLHLPGMGGMALLPLAFELDPDLAVIVVTGDREASTATAAMQTGFVDWLTKPFGVEDLGPAIERALAHRERQQQRQETEEWLRQEVAERRAALHSERQNLEVLATASLEVLVGALEAKDRFMAGHSARVGQLAASLAAELDHTDDEIELVRTAGRLHDLGMITVSDRVLNRRGALTEAEFDQIRQHPVVGDQLLRQHPNLGEVARVVRGHHERWDGKGYPDGLAGNDIPWGGRILAAAEVYDALVTDRVYRPTRMSPEEACRQMEGLAAAATDPEVHAALATVVARRHALEFLSEEESGSPEARPSRSLI
jgi:putative two-component system response regulator